MGIQWNIYALMRACLMAALLWQMIYSSALASVELTENMPMHRLLGYQLLEDPQADFDPATIIRGEYDAEFIDADFRKSSLGITDAAWWLRFEVVNMETMLLGCVLHYPFPMVDFVDVYQVSEEGALLGTYQLGEKRPLRLEAGSSEGYAVELQLPAGSKQFIYIRLYNPLGDVLDSYLEVGDLSAFSKEQDWIHVLLGFIMGGGVIILLYNVVIWVVVREQIYGWYIAYLLGALVTFAVVSGFWHRFFVIPSGFFTEAVPPIASSLTFMLLVQFSRHFLGTRQTVPRVDFGLRVFMGMLLGPIVLFFTGYGSLAAKYAMFSSIMLNVMPVLGLYLWRKGNRVALIYAVAWFVWLFAICGLSGRALGWLPTNDFTLRLGWLGIWGEAVIFALALGARIKILREAKSEAEARERLTLQQSNLHLEGLVAERTRDLQNKRDELQVINSEKDKFFSIIAHDLRNPLQGVCGLSGLLCENLKSFTKEELQENLEALYRGAEQLQRLLENLLAWSQLQKGIIRLHCEACVLQVVMNDCVSVFENSAKQKRIRFQLNLETNLQFYADRYALETVIRNLLSNAIKYSNPESEVRITGRGHGEQIEISVEDSGLGMDTEKLTTLMDLGEHSSTPGTEGEVGSGLGLQLCKELLKLHASTLTIESRLGQGSRFSFKLPAIGQ